MPDLAAESVKFLFADIEDSAQKWGKDAPKAAPNLT